MERYLNGFKSINVLMINEPKTAAAVGLRARPYGCSRSIAKIERTENTTRKVFWNMSWAESEYSKVRLSGALLEISQMFERCSIFVGGLVFRGLNYMTKRAQASLKLYGWGRRSEDGECGTWIDDKFKRERINKFFGVVPREHHRKMRGGLDNIMNMILFGSGHGRGGFIPNGKIG